MKKTLKFLVAIFILITFVTFPMLAQLDSTAIQTVVQTGVSIADATNNNIIPNVPNSLTSSLLTVIVGLIIRFFEKRKLKKQAETAAAGNNG